MNMKKGEDKCSDSKKYKGRKSEKMKGENRYD